MKIKQSTTTLTLLVPALVAFVALSACEPIGDTDGFFDSCVASEGDVQVNGTWTLSGEGSVYDCNDPELEGDITLKSPALTIVQGPSDTDPDAQMISLREPISVPGGTFELRGDVQGSCVNFEAREVSDQGTITYKFIGYASLEGSDDIVGTFTITGPRDCQGNGDFRVQVR